MTKEQIFNYFYTNSANLNAKAIVTVMLAGLLISAIIYLTYYVTYQGVAYNAKFNASLVVTLLISVVIMLMISSNIVISLGMVGALSIVRFRTAIKDSRDTVFIFWAIAEGLSVGSDNFKLALLTSLFIAVVLLAFALLPKSKQKYLIVICGKNERIDTQKVQECIEQYAKKTQMRSANQDEEHQEFIFEMQLKEDAKLALLENLSKVKGVTSVNWVSQTGDMVG